MACGKEAKSLAKKARKRKSQLRLRDQAGRYSAQPPPGPQIPGGSSFLSLPPGICNMIYRLLLVASKPLGNPKRRVLILGDQSELIYEIKGHCNTTIARAKMVPHIAL